MKKSDVISAFSGMIELEARWKEAFRKQDGYGLHTLLRGKPDLLFVQYGGCNVLHLAIRNRWYGLVRDVLLKFCPLHTDASADDSQPTQYFSQEQFWCLLKSKESGAEFPECKYASGLDVLAMAVVQGHGAINTILAEAVQTVGGALQYYGGEVIRWKAGEMAEDSIDRCTTTRPTLIRIIAECFTGESIEGSYRETANERAHAAPTVSASATGFRGTPGGSGESIQSFYGESIKSFDRERENERAHGAPTVSASATVSQGTPGDLIQSFYGESIKSFDRERENERAHGAPTVSASTTGSQGTPGESIQSFYGESIKSFDRERENERAHGAPTVFASATGSQGTPEGSGESIESSDSESIKSCDRERENERAHGAPTVSASATGSQGTPRVSGEPIERFDGESIKSCDRERENERAHGAPTVSASAAGSQGTPGGYGESIQSSDGESIKTFVRERENERAHGAPTVSASATGSQGTPWGYGESIESSDGESIKTFVREWENERAHGAPTVSASARGSQGTPRGSGESVESSDSGFTKIFERAHAARTVSALATGSHGTPGDYGLNLLQQQLEDKIDPAWKKEWKVTSPFLPFEEFLFLACCFPPVAWRRSSSFYEVRNQVLRKCACVNEWQFADYLLHISDTWGMAIHHAVHAEETSTTSESVLSLVLEIDFEFAYIRDTSRRTAFYFQLARGLEEPDKSLVALVGAGVVDASKYKRKYGRWSFGKNECEIDVKAVSGRNGYSPHEPFSEGEILGFYSILRSPHIAESKRIGWMTEMIFAAYRGDAADVQYFAGEDTYDPAKLQNLCEPALDDIGGVVPKLLNCSALHIAAAAGHPHVIRAILATGKFDPLVEDWEGNSALHLATHFETPLHFPHSLADFCVIPDRRIGNSYTEEFARERKELLRIAESRRQGCINLLLQAGIDVWQTNKKQEIADPGPRCSPEYSTWWYERVSKETLAAKSSLTAGANAISVTAALVATASYIGPLQPPLGYAGQYEGMQVGELTVRIFIVCNTLAFYLALAAIMLSLTPSLPMPRESTLDELKLIRRTVTLAVGLLILSIVAVLISFASASIAVIPDDDSWNHGGLTVSTISVGGFICLLVLILCLFRVVRLAFHRNKFVRRLYRKYVCM